MHGIISIQSHVVYGCAGNSSAIFPLQRLGFNVWPIHTVQFSNHTQYKQGWKGTILAEGGITELFDGLNNIDATSKILAVISGYLGSGNQAIEIFDNLQRVKKSKPNILYICDPVMGDPKKGCIVPPEVTKALCNNLLPCADIITPNQFELSQLTNINITDLESAILACKEAQKLGPSLILVKHLHYTSTNAYTMLMASKEGVYLIERPLINFDREPVGVGDLITSLFVGNLLSTDNAITAFEKTNQAVYQILKTTKELNEWELQIIEAQDDITCNAIEYFSTKVAD